MNDRMKAQMAEATRLSDRPPGSGKADRHKLTQKLVMTQLTYLSKSLTRLGQTTPLVWQGY
jgi:hypothetical protein